MSANKFVFVVCGEKGHLDTLRFSLRYLKHFSKNEIIVVTDTSRNSAPIIHELIIDIKTPENFTHHQASIYLKTGLNKFLPKGFTYCYLDTDVVALSAGCDEIFNYKTGPVTFAADHCRMPQFSLSAVNCDCTEQNNIRIAEIEALKEKYDPRSKWRDPIIQEKRDKLLERFEIMRRNKIGYLYTSLRFNLARNRFKLDDDNFFDRKDRTWYDKEGNVIIPYDESMIADIETNSSWRWNAETQRWIDADGRDVYNLACPHLHDYILSRFGIEVKDKNFQHWNGGVFLFDHNSEDFMNAWFDKTMQIFTWPEWKVRDQGTLIATAWQFGLQNNPVLPKRFNFISDWNNIYIMVDEEGNFTDDAFVASLKPALIHIYHNFGRRGWGIWDYVSCLLPGDNRALEDSLCSENVVRMGDNNVINGLWIGNELSVVEMLTIHSFIRMGHTFHLWLYEPLKNDLPPQVVICDANEIIPRSSVFRYSKVNQYGHGKGSVSGFSDIFRYKLLYEKGGWWVDMDVTCLQPFDIREPYFFRSHHDLNMVGNVMKCPINSELMRLCYEEAVLTVDSENTDWHKPIKILNKYVKRLGLQKYVHSGCGNADDWRIVEEFIYSNTAFAKNFLFVHWMNEEWRTRKIDKNDIPYRSALGKLLVQYKLMQKPVGKYAILKKDFYYFFKAPRLYSSFFKAKLQVVK